MKHITIFIIILLGMSVVVADIIGTTSKTITIDKTKLDALKLASNQTTIKPEVSAVSCDDNECWAWIYQKDLINTEWRVEKGSYTTAQLETMRDAYVKKRLEEYADVYLNRTSQVPVEVVAGGNLTFTDK